MTRFPGRIGTTPSPAILHLLMAMVIAIQLSGLSEGAAQDAAPESPLASLGLPELRIVVSDDGSDVPAAIAAGRVLVVLENQGTPDGPAAVSDVNILRAPDGVTLDDLNTAFLAGDGVTPEWFADLESLGGFYVAAGDTGYAVLDFLPGTWFIGVGDANPYTLLTVSAAAGATPATGVTLPADVAVGWNEFSIDLPAQVAPGTHVWHGVNDGEQLHELMLIRTPGLLSVDQVIALFMVIEGGGTPPPGVPDPSTLEFVVPGLKTMSGGREIWAELNLEPGFYVAICGVLDPSSGQSHALLGEIQVFTVGDQATPAS